MGLFECRHCLLAEKSLLFLLDIDTNLHLYILDLVYFHKNIRSIPNAQPHLYLTYFRPVSIDTIGIPTIWKPHYTNYYFYKIYIFPSLQYLSNMAVRTLGLHLSLPDLSPV